MSEKTDLISVIVPIYNTEAYLSRCVGSIRQQSYSHLEIILVDDGSTDGCAKLSDKWSAEDRRIKVIHKQNAGQGLARNDGLEIAAGRYVTFIDSDDWISLTHVERLYDALREHEADAALGNHTRVTADGTCSQRLLPLREGVYDREAIVDEIMLPLIGAEPEDSRDILVNSSVSMNLYSMDLIREKGIRFISERYAVAEDFFFNVDFFQHAEKVVHTGESGYYYFQNSASTCEKYNPNRFERTLNYYGVIREKVSQYGLLDRAERRIWRSFLMKIRVAIRHIVQSDLSCGEKRRQIEAILNDSTVSAVLAAYPIESYIPSMRLLASRMRGKDVNGVYWLMYLRESARNTRLLRQALRLMGIGK